MKMKKIAKIDNWEITKHPLYLDYILIGKIVDHENQSNFKSNIQATSPLLNIDLVNKTAETQNTLYILLNEANNRIDS